MSSSEHGRRWEHAADMRNALSAPCRICGRGLADRDGGRALPSLRRAGSPPPSPPARPGPAGAAEVSDLIIAEPKGALTAPGMVGRAVGARSDAAVVVSVGGGVPERRTARLHERLVSYGVGGPPPGVR